MPRTRTFRRAGLATGLVLAVAGCGSGGSGARPDGVSAAQQTGAIALVEAAEPTTLNYYKAHHAYPRAVEDIVDVQPIVHAPDPGLRLSDPMFVSRNFANAVCLYVVIELPPKPGQAAAGAFYSTQSTGGSSFRPVAKGLCKD